MSALDAMKEAADFCQPTDPTEAPTLANALDAARADVIELAEAARALRRNVDVSTIRPGKRNEAQWAALAARVDAALARVQP